jgi:hypothetical protein
MVTITFGCTDDYVFTDKSIHPQPMRNFAPEWYKNIPTNLPNPDEQFAYLSNRARTVKTCPSFIDVFKEGVVLLSVQDVLLKYISDIDEYAWQVPYTISNEISNNNMFENHGNTQYVNHLPKAANIKHVVKYNLPFTVHTPKGYSVRQLPMPYYFNPDWHMSYGILDSDNIHEINLQINITSADKEILIRKGEPLGVYVPFKREEHKLKVVRLHDNKKLLSKARYSRYITRARFKKAYKDLYK